MRQRVSQIFLCLVASLLLAACSGSREMPEVCMEKNVKCVLAPRRATSKPYKIKGEWYHPQPHYDYDEVGIASYYGGGDVFHGRRTATGAVFDKHGITAAHKTLPLPCIAEITNLENGRQLQVEVNDRGPFVERRIIDVSRRVAQLLGFEDKGTANVRVRALVPESLALNGLDAPAVMLAEGKSPPSDVNLTPTVEAPTAMAELPRLPETLFEEKKPPPVVVASSPSVKPHVKVSKGIFVQVGGYENHKDAYVLSKSLEKVTKSPSQPVKNKGSKHYVVRVGPLPSMLQANQVLDQLVDAGHVMSRIVIHQ